MPELPEVETTVRGLERILPGLKMADIWTDYKSPFHAGKDNIKNPLFYKKFVKEVAGQKVTGVSRRAKNILIHLENGKTILIHMKMTGHLLYGRYEQVTPKVRSISGKNKKIEGRGWHHESWVPVGAANSATENSSADNDESGVVKNSATLRNLRDPFNKFIHFVFILSNGKHLAFSDMRKFAKITLIDSQKLDQSADLNALGPEPLDPSFTFAAFKTRLAKRPNSPIKQVLMDQSVIAGIGNIYSDEILWYAGVHPQSRTGKIPDRLLRKIYEEMHAVLERSISLGGDSMSDFRNLAGEKGGFHPYHAAYRQTGKSCTKPSCAKIFRQTGGKRGAIVRLKIGGRSTHFCPVHQKLF